jgi:hypothetical protein
MAARSSLGFNIVTGPEWVRVIEALGRVDRELPGRLKRSLKDDAEDLADVARGRVLGLPTPRNAGHTGLRAKVAKGVHVEDRGEGGIRVVAEMKQPNESYIPRGLDTVKGWRHPLFGDKSRWFSNPGYDWFLSTFEQGEKKFESGLDRVLARAADEIADAAS